MALSDWTGADIRKGQRFHLDEGNGEVLTGVVDRVFFDSAGDPAAVSVKLDEGRWASVDLSKCRPETISPQ